MDAPHTSVCRPQGDGRGFGAVKRLVPAKLVVHGSVSTRGPRSPLAVVRQQAARAQGHVGVRRGTRGPKMLRAEQKPQRGRPEIIRVEHTLWAVRVAPTRLCRLTDSSHPPTRDTGMPLPARFFHSGSKLEATKGTAWPHAWGG